jgi:mono/diheme cytochrome c family protein
VTKGMASIQPLYIATALVLLSLLGHGCDYGRMYDQDSVKTYERKAPLLDGRTIPIENGYNTLASSNTAKLTNPLSDSKETIRQGLLAYSYYCVQCHGAKLDGHGRVGQSFSPLPTDLTSRAVQSLDDGTLYTRILLGFGRHPRLFSTVSADETWSIIAFVRSKKQAGQ